MPIVRRPAPYIDLNWSGVYWTHEELFGNRLTEAEVISLVEQLALDDLLDALGRLSCMVEGGALVDADRQTRIVHRIGFTPEAAHQLEARLRDDSGPTRTLFFPQQIVHLTRLALEHGARRPRDRFAAGTKSEPFLRALFGVTDVFGDDLGDRSTGDTMSYILRQLGLMARPESLILFSRYYDLLVRRWPTVIGDDVPFQPATEFREFTGLTLERYFTIGFGIYSRFLRHAKEDEEPAEFAVHPEPFFSDTRIPESDWRGFLRLLSARPDALRDSLREERDRYGAGQYRAHTFDRTPLVALDDGSLVPTSFAALERAVTEGMFWILADAAEAQGLKREAFTSPFGKVFEDFAQEALERTARQEPRPPTTYRDFEYGPKRNRSLSSDMTLVYDRDAVFCEIVTGRPNVATVTRGDVRSFWGDVERLIAKKARQLRRCLNDLQVFGILRFDGVGCERLQRVWPVVVMIEEFPLMPPLRGEIETRLRRENWPKGVPRLTFIDADELGALEALVEQGWTVRGVLARWKREAPDLPMSNWLAQRRRDGDPPLGHASWYRESFRDLMRTVGKDVFGNAFSEEGLAIALETPTSDTEPEGKR